jgi:hypothetical protein
MGVLGSRHDFRHRTFAGRWLAQQFAYSLPPDPDVPRLTRVFAFDPSPVTGFYSVPENTRNRNSQGLAIDRIYERGEILALLQFFGELRLSSQFHEAGNSSGKIQFVLETPHLGAFDDRARMQVD